MSRGLTSLRAEVARRARSLRAFAAEVRRRILGGRARVTTAARKGPLRLTVLPPGRSATVPPDADYVYAPVVAEQALDPIALGNAALCLTHRGYDFILFSRSLAELPRITAPREVRQSVVFASRLSDVFLRGAPPSSRLRGRLVRMPGLRDGSPETGLGLLFQGAVAGREWGEIEWGPGAAAPLQVRGPSDVAFATVPPKTKPRIFVWPALWAVGGVERNTIEIMRRLRDRYEFVVVTIERLNEGLGSLHHQLTGLAAATYDLAELAPLSDYLAMLNSLKQSWAPDLVWICNGSPWQCDHAAALRALYADTPIVDQEVYDTRAGWINRYHEPGIQSFDRFIAINRRIREAFVERLGMDPGRIDLIYPAFDASRFRVDSRPPKEFEDLKESFGLPRDRPVFLFVGRMNPQKRPLHFVDLACRLDASEFRASFFMLGDGELAPEVDAAIAQSPAGLLRRLPFTDRVPEILAMAEGLVITSEYEGLPIAMLEALAMGVPVLSTDVGDVRLILEEYKTGAIVEGIGDPGKLVEAFQAWRSALPAYRRAAQDAASKMATRFSAATLAAQYEESWLKAHRTLRGREMRPLASKASGRT